MSRTGSGRTSVWAAVCLPALAGGLGWGIRGQYGHETGAMIAGVLVALVLALLFSPEADSLRVARAVAWGTLAMGIGGSMTYGQTIGLTHDAELIGNWAALRWGMLGLAIKGAVWIGFAGVFLGMGFSGHRYRPGEIAVVMLTLMASCAVGIWLLNEPYDPAREVLPYLYFSADWRWLPDATLKPRREYWGGLLVALLTLIAYARWRRQDSLAWRLALWGMLGGAVGFPLGQCLQAFAAWNRDTLSAGFLREVVPLINWWNFMETTFGAVMGATLGLGLWLNRARVFSVFSNDGGHQQEMAPVDQPLPPLAESLLFAIHTWLLVSVEFLSLGWVDAIYDFGLVLVAIPLVAVAGGRWWPFGVILPLVTLPIAGKTVAAVVYQNASIPPVGGWLIYLGLPVAVTGLAAAMFGSAANRLRPARAFLRPALLLVTWLFFGLNFAVFRFPWPWAEWTVRTPNAIVFAVCAAGLTWFAVRNRPTDSRATGTPRGLE